MSNKASQYQKKTPREHVLLRPDTYIGDIEKTTDEMYICGDSDRIEKKKITIFIDFVSKVVQSRTE